MWKGRRKQTRNLEFIPDQYKTQMMCERAVEDEQETLEFVPDQYNIQMMCETAFEKYTRAIEFVRDQYKTKGICNEAVEAYPCTLKFVPDKYKTQMICEKAFEKPWLLLLEYAPDYFKTLEACDKAVRDDMWCGEICGMINIIMMMVIIGLLRVMMMTNFLSGMMGIKNVRSRKQKQKKNSRLYLGTHRNGGIGVGKEMQKNCGHKYGLFCILWPDTKNFFD